MKTSTRPHVSCLFKFLFLIAFLSGFSVRAVTLDDYNLGVSGYTTVLNGGTFGASSPVGQLLVTTVGAPGGLTYGKKTTQTFTNLATHTIEFRVTANSIFTNTTPTNALALLGWVPVGGAVGANGYVMGVGPLGAAILVNSSFVYITNFVTPIASSNLVLVLRMTTVASSVVIRSSVYSKADGRFTVLWENTVTNASGLIGGLGGNAVVGAYNDPSGASTTVNFDDLQVYDTIRTLLDDFSGPYPAGWIDTLTGNGATNYNDGSGHLRLVGGTGNNQVTGTLKGDKTFKITDGVRLELRLDVVSVNYNDAGQFLFLDYSPTPTGFASLAGYSIAHSSAQFYIGKAYGNWWDAAYTSLVPIPTSNYRLIQTFSGEGASVRIQSRLEDLSVGVNDPARIVYQRSKVDSTSAYQNFDGYFAIGIFNGGSPANGDFTVDNAEVDFTANTGNQTPIITAGPSPASGKAFYDPAGTVTFTATDDVSIPAANISATLNGVTYASGNPNVTINPAGGTSTSRQFTLTNLAPNTFYSGTIQATDNLGATKTLTYSFDTFSTTNLQVESEDFNYSDNVGVDGGKFHDGAPQLQQYYGVQGTPEIDYHDSRTSGNTDDPYHYRDLDFPRTYVTGDGPRAAYVTASVPELLTYDNENGDWRNYTRTFPAGTFKVYSRQSTFALPRSLVTLGRVTSDPTTTGQTTTELGSFVQKGGDAGDTGYDVHRDVPLTDAFGNPTVVRFAGGVDTVRVTDRYVNDREDANVFQNYLVLIPTADPGTLRPIVTQTAPIAGDTFRQSPATERTFASIANRDTSVTNVVSLQINGVTVPTTNTVTSGGIDVDWSFLSVPAKASITNKLIYQDNSGIGGDGRITNTWIYAYPLLRASNSLSLNALSTRGFAYRMVQTDGATLGNSISRAEGQLATPPSYTIDRSWSTNDDITLDWNDNTGTPKYVPGLDGGISGYAPGPYDNIATESLSYMQLTAGAHRFNIISDDGYELRSGTTPGDLTATVMGYQNGTFNGTLDFLVEADGLYPTRTLWYENGGGASFTLRSVDLSDGSTVLVNDPANPAGVVKVFNVNYAVTLLSSITVNGTYTVDNSAVVDLNARTVTVASGALAKKFYKIQAPSATKIDSITISGASVVMHYTFQ